MTFSSENYKVQVEDVNGWAFVHSFTGNGPAEELKRFAKTVVSSLECPTVTCVDGEAKARFYSRLGFVDTGETLNGHRVMVKGTVN